MKKNFLTLWAFCVFGGVAIAVKADTDSNTNSDGTTTQPRPRPYTSQAFVRDAATSGMKEVALSQIALGKTENEEVKRFARHMINDHIKANQKLSEIAASEGLDFPPTNTFSPNDVNWNNPLITETVNLKGAQLLTMTNLPYLASYQTVHRLNSLGDGQFDQAYLDAMVSDHSNAVSEFAFAKQNLTDEKLRKYANKTLPILIRHSNMAQEMAAKMNM